MNELESLRQEAETLKNAIRVSIHTVATLFPLVYLRSAPLLDARTASLSERSSPLTIAGANSH
jgi:hypothetical protein